MLCSSVVIYSPCLSRFFIFYFFLFKRYQKKSIVQCDTKYLYTRTKEQKKKTHNFKQSSNTFKVFVFIMLQGNY